LIRDCSNWCNPLFFGSLNGQFDITKCIWTLFFKSINRWIYTESRWIGKNTIDK
jgi:hypothetical protein